MAGSFDRKLRFFVKQLAWLFFCIIVGIFCSWGIFTSVQYAHDACVRQGKGALALDHWLITACVYDMVFCTVVWLLLCCHARGGVRRAVIWPMHIGNLAWTAAGIWVVVESSMRCPHNTLWIVSVVLISLTLFSALTLLVVWVLNRIGLCNVVGSYLSIEETPYDDVLLMLQQSDDSAAADY